MRTVCHRSRNSAELLGRNGQSLCCSSLTVVSKPGFAGRPHISRRRQIMSIPTATAPARTVVDAGVSAGLGPTLHITGPVLERQDEILTAPANAYLTELHHRFGGR